ncbi:MAG TPA: 50S ribosomal protein L10 [Candidatus Nanoarchaeia archaeon]|nr:50S ribosomal protein L10 [Candidatus Nanoarchaeia archaeon]
MVSENKKLILQGLVDDIKTYPIIGVVNMQNLPAQQLQVMRSTLRNKGVKIVMKRKKILRLALEKSGRNNIDQLSAKIKGMPALLFTRDNPFSLYSTLQKNKSEAPAKSGQISPKDIIVKAGATNFAPGPIISELASVGIKTKVESGKLTIVADVIVAKEGETIKPKLAETLKRLDIKPMEVGLDLVAVWENGLVFDAKQLHIDEAEFNLNIIKASQWAMNLALECGYLTEETTELLIQKLFREAKAVAIESAYLTAETKDELLAKSEQQALSIKEEANL